MSDLELQIKIVSSKLNFCKKTRISGYKLTQKLLEIELNVLKNELSRMLANGADKSTKPALNMQSVNVSICCKTCKYHNIDNEIKHRCSNTVSNDELSDKLNGSVCGNWKQKAV